MNKLYLRTVEYDAYNKKGDRMIVERITCLHYGEIPEMESSEIAFNYLYDYYGDKCFGRRIESNYRWRSYMTEREFLNATRTVCYKEVDEDSYTMKQLMEKLSSKEFIAYCKDNGLNVCPMR